jgi:hypothetical protein
MSGKPRAKKRGGRLSVTLLKLVGGALFALSLYVTLSHRGLPPHASSDALATSRAAAVGTLVDPAVLDLIRIQNETIVALRRQLELVAAAKLPGQGQGKGGDTRGGDSSSGDEGGSDSSSSSASSYVAELAASHAELAAELAHAQADVAALRLANGSFPATAAAGGSTRTPLLPKLLRTQLDEECEARFGLGLSDMIR